MGRGGEGGGTGYCFSRLAGCSRHRPVADEAGNRVRVRATSDVVRRHRSLVPPSRCPRHRPVADDASNVVGRGVSRCFFVGPLAGAEDLSKAAPCK